MTILDRLFDLQDKEYALFQRVPQIFKEIKYTFVSIYATFAYGIALEIEMLYYRKDAL